MCLGDKQLLQRLVEMELRKSSGISRREAALRAIDSLQRDNARPRLKGLDEMPPPHRTLRVQYLRLRAKFRQSTFLMYAQHSFEIAMVVLVLYGLSRLLGLEFPK
jgi:hypothetical protein